VLNRLGYEQTVEGVAMEGRKPGKGSHRTLINRKRGDAMVVAALWQIYRGRRGEWKFPELVLDHRLPDRNSAQEYLVNRVLNGSLVGRREPLVASDKSEEDVCIEQDPHGVLLPLETLQDFLRQWRIEIVGNGELARGQTVGARSRPGARDGPQLNDRPVVASHHD